MMQALTEEFAIWPRQFDRVQINIWFEEEGIEWRLGILGGGGPPVLSQLPLLRTLPERTALGYATPITPESLARFGAFSAAMLVGGAGGVVTAEARQQGEALFSLIERAQPSEMAAAWVSPPAGRPELGGARLLVTDWARPELLDTAIPMVMDAIQPGSMVAQTLSQIGWKVEITLDPEIEGAGEMRILPADNEADPYYHAAFVVRRNTGRIALAIGDTRVDATARNDILLYRAELANNAVFSEGDGDAATRNAYVRMGQRGASRIGIFDPVRFIQLALIESADWRPRSPDQHEPLSTQLAREMLDYGSAGAWTIVGERSAPGWQISGGIGWESLARLAGALGITESIGMEY